MSLHKEWCNCIVIVATKCKSIFMFSKSKMEPFVWNLNPRLCVFILELLHCLKKFLAVEFGFKLGYYNDILRICGIICDLGKTFNSSCMLSIHHYDCFAKCKRSSCSKKLFSCLQWNIKVIILCTGNLNWMKSTLHF